MRRFECAPTAVALQAAAPLPIYRQGQEAPPLLAALFRSGAAPARRRARYDQLCGAGTAIHPALSLSLSLSLSLCLSLCLSLSRSVWDTGAK
jgi:hypothetical protein